MNSVLALLDGAFCLYYSVLSKSSNTAVSEVIATLSVGSPSGAHCGECSLGSGTPDWREASSLGLRPLCAAAPPARRPVRTARSLPMTSPLVSRPRFLAQGPCAKQPPSGGSTQGRCSQHPCLTSLLQAVLSARWRLGLLPRLPALSRSAVVAGFGVEGPHGHGKLDLLGDDVSYRSAVDAADGDHRRVHWIVFPRHNCL